VKGERTTDKHLRGTGEISFAVFEYRETETVKCLRHKAFLIDHLVVLLIKVGMGLLILRHNAG
jgi:hypothetical protein